jgi:hypothetical protein
LTPSRCLLLPEFQGFDTRDTSMTQLPKKYLVQKSVIKPLPDETKYVYNRGLVSICTQAKDATTRYIPTCNIDGKPIMSEVRPQLLFSSWA